MSKWSATPWSLQSSPKPKDIAPPPARRGTSQLTTKAPASISAYEKGIKTSSKNSTPNSSISGALMLGSDSTRNQKASSLPSPPFNSYANADSMLAINDISHISKFVPASKVSPRPPNSAAKGLILDHWTDVVSSRQPRMTAYDGEKQSGNAATLQVSDSMENYDGIPREYDTTRVMQDSSTSSGGKKKKKTNATPRHLQAIELLRAEEFGKVPLKVQLRGLHKELSEDNTSRDLPLPPAPPQQQPQRYLYDDDNSIPLNEPFYFDNDDDNNDPLNRDSSEKFSQSPPQKHVFSSKKATMPSAMVSEKSRRVTHAPPPFVDRSYDQTLRGGSNSSGGGASVAFADASYSKQLQAEAGPGGRREYSAEELQQLQKQVDLLQQRHQQSFLETAKQREEDLALEAKFAELIIDRTRIEKVSMIGEGYFGEVWRGVWDGSLAVALKCLKHGVKNTVDKSKFFSEVSSLAKMRHPNVTVFYGATPPPEAYIISELLHCSLFQLIYSRKHESALGFSATARPSASFSRSPLPLMAILRILSDVSYGGNYLHNMKPSPVIHRDLTSSNVLLTIPADISDLDLLNACADLSKPIAKLTDFGLSREVDWCMTACVGNLFYLAPEVYTGEHYTESADIYSFGILMWELVTRESPHGGVNPQRVAFLAATQNLRPPLDEKMQHVTSEPFRALIRRCWHADPQERPSFREVALQLQNLRNAQLPSPPPALSASSSSSPSPSSAVSYHAFSDASEGEQVQQHQQRHQPRRQEIRQAQDPWQHTRRMLDAFLLNRPSMDQLKSGLIQPWTLREHQEDSARSLPPGHKQSSMHALLASLPEEERPAAIRAMLLKRAVSGEVAKKQS